MSPTALTHIQDPGNAVLVSAATHWEIAIKLSTWKLKLAEDFGDFVQHAIFDNGLALLRTASRFRS